MPPSVITATLLDCSYWATYHVATAAEARAVVRGSRGWQQSFGVVAAAIFDQQRE